MSTPPPETVLLVRDSSGVAGEPALAQLQLRYAVLHAHEIGPALHVLREQCPRLVLIADDLPDARALTLLRGFVPLWPGPYVLLADARHDIGEQIVALESGFDDVWTASLDARLVVARARALIRRPVRTSELAPDALQVHGLVIDRTRRVLSYREREVALSPREADVLTVLMQHGGRIVERPDFRVADSIASQITPAAVDLVVFRLRQRLEAVAANHVSIVVARGRGYALRLRAGS